MDEEYRKRLDSYLFRDEYLPPTLFTKWVLRRGHGEFTILPPELRRIVYWYCRRWYRYAIPDAIMGGRMFEGYREVEMSDGSIGYGPGCRYYTPTTPLALEMESGSDFGRWAGRRLFRWRIGRHDD